MIILKIQRWEKNIKYSVLVRMVAGVVVVSGEWCGTGQPVVVNLPNMIVIVFAF